MELEAKQIVSITFDGRTLSVQGLSWKEDLRATVARGVVKLVGRSGGVVLGPLEHGRVRVWRENGAPVGWFRVEIR